MKRFRSTVRVLSAVLAVAAVLAACATDDDPLIDDAEAPKEAGARQVEVARDAAPREASAPPTPFRDAAAPTDARAATCLLELERRGVDFERAEARGVVDAVRLTGPVNGVLFASNERTTSTTDPMACEFVLTLWDFATLLATQGVVRVGTLGAYCYRCCCAWSESNDCRGPDDPEPACGSKGFSNHSYGRALDVRYLWTATGESYDINSNSDWRVSSAATCGAAQGQQVGTSKLLYGLACAAVDQGIFTTVLTPNYNGSHRNHWHMDTADRDDGRIVVRSLPAPSGPAGVDTASHDVCGAEYGAGE